jgi:hypothetical protein
MIAPANTPLEASPAPASGSSLDRHRAVVRVLLAAILAAVVLAGLSLGAVPLPSGVVLGLLAQALELPIPAEPTEAQAAVLLHIRLPRVILGMLVGGGLAMAGAAMQALFRNPLADPAIIGVSSGAALVAVAVIVLGDTVLQTGEFQGEVLVREVERRGRLIEEQKARLTWHGRFPDLGQHPSELHPLPLSPREARKPPRFEVQGVDRRKRSAGDGVVLGRFPSI